MAVWAAPAIMKPKSMDGIGGVGPTQHHIARRGDRHGEIGEKPSLEPNAAITSLSGSAVTPKRRGDNRRHAPCAAP